MTPGTRPQKKPDYLKSQPFRFRLHPEIEEEAEVMRIIEEAMNRPDYGLRRLVVDAVTYFVHNYVPDRDSTVSSHQLSEIHNYLQQIAEHLEGVTQPVEEQPRRATSKHGGKLNVSEDFLGSLGRFLSSGMTADEVDDDE